MLLKEVLLKELDLIPDFFEHALILTKCLVPCMFELTDVYYINLILITLPSRCFVFKIFLRSSKLINKTKDYIKEVVLIIYICLTKRLPGMTST